MTRPRAKPRRLSRSGKGLNKPITTAFRTNALLPAYHGPFSTEISPDGETVAYTYSFIASGGRGLRWSKAITALTAND